VFTIENNTAHLHVVLKGDPMGDLVRIVSGLSGNETLAASNQAALYDGAPVQVK